MENIKQYLLQIKENKADIDLLNANTLLQR